MGPLQPELTARAALRLATRDVHERLHEAPPFLELARGRLMAGGYAELLGALGGFYFSLPPQLSIEPARLARLEQDLASLGTGPSRPVQRPFPPGEDEALGWRYVVEGSIFGGRVIYRQLDYLFGAKENGRRFFQGTPASGWRWNALCARLEQAGSEPGATARMIAGAYEAFAAFETMIAARKPAHA